MAVYGLIWLITYQSSSIWPNISIDSMVMKSVFQFSPGNPNISFLEGRPGFILNFCGRKGHLPTREAQFCP